MSEIKLNQEMICALQNCKDAKSVMALAKAKGIEISGEQAEKLFAILQNDKLSDEDLEKVVGGVINPIVGGDRELNPGGNTGLYGFDNYYPHIK